MNASSSTGVKMRQTCYDEQVKQKEAFTMNIRIVGIDLAKDVFQICALNASNNVIFNRSVRRAGFLKEISKLPTTTIAMEACGSAHHWGRVLESLGHTVRLIPPQHVKAYVRNGKSDAKDALAICEAAQRPLLHTVPIKSVEQQDIQLLHRVRSRYVQMRTALANQIRSIAQEYGVIFPKSIRCLRAELSGELENADNGLSATARATIGLLYEELQSLDDKELNLQRQIEALAKQNDNYVRLREIPGIGPIIASAFIAAVGNGHQFQRGRQVSAWLGLVPRQHGTGGKIQLFGISKGGDRYLRTLLIHGARVVASWSLRRAQDNRPMARWLRALIARRGKNKAIVALANKLARIAWVILARGERFDQAKAFAAA